MLNSMSSKELADWQAYYTLEPWGDERADLRMGVLCALIANMFRKKGSRPHKAEEFVLKFWKETASPEMMLQKVRQINAMFKGTDKTADKTPEMKGK